jgi:uncharacterized protein HemY
MPQFPRKFLAWASLACVSLASAPLYAETLQELEALSDLSFDETAGIAAARAQANQGGYLEALATLERVLAVHPKSHEARLIHAIYLCKIDDRRGGLVEISKLKKKHYGKELLAESRAMCEPAKEG